MKVLNDDTLDESDVAVVFDRYDKENSIQFNLWKEAVEEVVKLCQVTWEPCCT